MTEISFEQVVDVLHQLVAKDKKDQIRTMVLSSIPTTQAIDADAKDIKQWFAESDISESKRREFACCHWDYIQFINQVGEALAERFGEQYTPLDAGKEKEIFFGDALPNDYEV